MSISHLIDFMSEKVIKEERVLLKGGFILTAI